MIKAVIFDFGSVLIGGDWQKVYRKIAKQSKISWERIFEIVKPLVRKWNKAEINEKQFWQRLEKKIGQRLPREFKKDLWYRTYVEERADIKESWKIAVELKKKKFLLAILSNTIPLHLKVNKNLGRISRLKKLGFKTFVWSCEVGTRKPELKIYKIILKRLNLPARECLFIDDILINIKVARRLGIQGIHFRTPRQLREELNKLGLL